MEEDGRDELHLQHLLAHVSRSEEGDNRRESDPVGCYLPIILRGTNCAALIDSGNLWQSVISEKLARTLGLGKHSIKPITTKTVGTAKAGAALTVLGELKLPLQLRVAQTGQTFPFKPAVVRGLDMSVNISGPWLQHHGWDHLHSKGQLLIGGRAVALKDQDAAQGKSSAVYFATPTTVPGRGTAAARLLVPAVQQGLIRPGPGIFQTQQGWGLGANGEELNTGRGLAIADQEGSCYAILCNPGDGDVTIPAGRRYGVFTEAEEACSITRPHNVFPFPSSHAALGFPCVLTQGINSSVRLHPSYESVIRAATI